MLLLPRSTHNQSVIGNLKERTLEQKYEKDDANYFDDNPWKGFIFTKLLF